MRNTTRRGWPGRIGMLLAVLAVAGCSPVFGKTAHGAGTVVLTWTPPTTTTTGAPLTQLAGYDLYAGFNPSALRLIAHIEAKGIGRCTITGLAAGTWYFVVTSYTTDGTQSVPSNVVRKTLRGGAIVQRAQGPLHWICRAPLTG